MNLNQLPVAAIQQGTVIDHIPCDRLFEVVRLLHLEALTTSQVMIGYNLDSPKMGRKGIIKVADRFFSDEELNQLSVVAPDVTLCIIRDYHVTEKKQVRIPHDIRGIIRCTNPKCITNNEPMTTRFIHKPATAEGERGSVCCHYCEWEQSLANVKLL